MFEQWFLCKSYFNKEWGIYHLTKGFIPLRKFSSLPSKLQEEIKQDVSLSDINEKLKELQFV